MGTDLFSKFKERIINMDDNLYEDWEEYTLPTISNEEYLINNLNFYSNAPILKDLGKADLLNLYKGAFDENREIALKLLFYIRDKNNIVGDKKSFRILIHYLAIENTNIVNSLIHLIPLYGRWDDLYALFDTPCEENVIKSIHETLAKDMISPYPSTLAKWLKSENTSSKASCILGKTTRTLLNMTSKEYRITLSTLRNKIGIVESKMSSNKWEDIKYGDLSNTTIKKYKKAFLSHDKIGFEEYCKLNDTLKFKDSKKHLASFNYPYDFARRYIENGIIEKEVHFDKIIQEYKGDTLVTIGVMNCNKSALFAGIGAILTCNNENRGRFKEYFISSKDSGALSKLPSLSIQDKVNKIMSKSITREVNVESSLDAILLGGVKENLLSENMPKKLIVIVDERCKVSLLTKGEKNTPFFINAQKYEGILEKWDKEGYTIPKLLFWFIDYKRPNASIVNHNSNILFAFGYSDELFNSILNDKYDVTMDKMMSTIKKERYNLLDGVK